ncbi:uncharacterized protein L201_005022 [Kwoniella dendrophila CBS 6074]|uniref:Uncharacterized protein n=1 Tax=Kwoniella dendrophila CBS 6074 TaxID=1295534 RepID=A0AAX4JY14_9TREE
MPNVQSIRDLHNRFGPLEPSTFVPDLSIVINARLEVDGSTGRLVSRLSSSRVIPSRTNCTYANCLASDVDSGAYRAYRAANTYTLDLELLNAYSTNKPESQITERAKREKPNFLTSLHEQLLIGTGVQVTRVRAPKQMQYCQTKFVNQRQHKVAILGPYSEDSILKDYEVHPRRLFDETFESLDTRYKEFRIYPNVQNPRNYIIDLRWGDSRNPIDLRNILNQNAIASCYTKSANIQGTLSNLPSLVGSPVPTLRSISRTPIESEMGFRQIDNNTRLTPGVPTDMSGQPFDMASPRY